MSNSKKTSSIVSAIYAILLLSSAFYYIWTITQRAILRSCLFSFAGEIVEHSREISNFAKSRENWNVLTDDEVKFILSNERIKFENCSKLNSPPQDMKDKNLKIAVKKHGEYGGF